MSRTSNEESWVSGAAQAAAIAGIALIDPRDLAGSRRLAYRTAVAGVAGWGTWSAMDDDADDLPAIAGPLTVAAAVAGTFAVSRWSESWDARIHDRLERAGVARPRLVIAATSAGMTLAGWWLGRRADRAEAARRDDRDDLDDDRGDAHS